MKRLIQSLAAFSLLFAGFAAHGQTVVSGNTINITTPGSYILGTNASTIVISASNVTLDLAGRTVSSSHVCSLINNGNAPGCICSAQNCNGSLAGIKAVGNNVVIKNGIVEHQFGDGIEIFSPNGLGLLNAVVKDVTVDNNAGNGLAVYGPGAVVSNVQSYQNGHSGVQVMDNTRLDHVTASYNNLSGVDGSAGSGNYADIFSSWNKGIGVIANGNLARIDARSNGMQGIYPQGTLRDSNAEFNSGDGVYATQHGVVLGTTSAWNGGNGFSFGGSTCFSALSSFANSGTPILGGVPLVGPTASCN